MKAQGILWTWTVPAIGDDGENPTSAENPKTMKLPIKVSSTWSCPIRVDWGDGTITDHTSGTYADTANQHGYTSGGTKRVRVTSATGRMPIFIFGCYHYNQYSLDIATQTEREAITSLDYYYAKQYTSSVSKSNYFGFSYCANLEYVDPRCFVNYTSISIENEGYSNGVFAGAKIIKIKKETFQHLTEQRYFYGVCFHHFAQNPYLVSVDKDIFRNNTALQVLQYAFRGCINLASEAPNIPASITDVMRSFYGCRNLTGNAPELWNTATYPSITSYSGCFNGCTNLTNYADIPDGWK